MPNPGVIVLAAGGSSRMGRPKQLLPWGEHTLLRHCVAIAIASACQPVVVVLGCEADACRQALEGMPVTFVVNERWGDGLGSSLAHGINALESERPDAAGALVLLADQPFIKHSQLRDILNHWEFGMHSIVATDYDGAGGVPSIFGRIHFAELRELSGDKGAKSLIARKSKDTLLIPSGGNLVDLDTIQTYEQFRHSEQALTR